MKHSADFFVYRGEITRGRRATYLFVFKGTAASSQEECGSAITDYLAANLPPDHIVILVPEPDFEAFASIEPGSGLESAFQRIPSVLSVCLAAFNGNGRFVRSKVFRGRDIEISNVLNSNWDLVVSHGLFSILGEKGPGECALLRAPSGHLFTKPSQRAANFFIRAENLLFRSEETSFIAFALLQWIGERVRAHSSPIRVIFVDSMTIGTLAMAVADMLRYMGTCEAPPIVKSFGSYDGLNSETFVPPLSGSYVVLISASTSGSLARRWIEKCSCDPRDVVTLICFPGSGLGRQVLCEIPRPADLVLLPKNDAVDGFKEIHVVGEQFLQQPSKTKAVLLSMAHKPEGMDDAFESLAKSSTFDCFRYDPSRSSERSLFVDGESLVAEERFGRWLDDTVAKIAPASTRCVVHQSDAPSRQMAQRCVETLARFGIQRCEILDLDDLRERSSEKINGSVLIVAAVVSRGSELAEISQVLRDAQAGGGRCFLVGAQLCPTSDDIKRLSGNLSKAPGSVQYRVETYRKWAVGKVNQASSWQREKATYAGLTRGPLVQRLQRLRQSGRGMGDTSFFPSSASGHPLRLRPEFAFWPFDYDVVSTGSVLLTIASALQRAREDSRLSDEQRLASTTFQPVVIDPGSFARFNDGLIQASILRAAYPSELDYSGDDELSNSMFLILKDVLLRSTKPAGEAAAEFCCALATKRIALSRKDSARLCEVIDQLPANHLSAEIRALLKIWRSA